MSSGFDKLGCMFAVVVGAGVALAALGAWKVLEWLAALAK